MSLEYLCWIIVGFLSLGYLLGAIAYLSKNAIVRVPVQKEIYVWTTKPRESFNVNWPGVIMLLVAIAFATVGILMATGVIEIGVKVHA